MIWFGEMHEIKKDIIIAVKPVPERTENEQKRGILVIKLPQIFYTL